ncbi:GAF domain-containing protein [Waterburya agarophytonicola K14]|uniref:histidine kinase n=2 Tax=Waterburya TaxID=2886915 RepID=A0A964FFZ2_9CYAN|nr:GAF domain-containing protein [Waterburya agarophytonicola KI4]
MQHSIQIEQMVSNILQIILKSQNCDRILSDVASQVGNLLSADICVIVSATDNQPNKINYWCKEQDSGLLPKEVIDYLTNLSLIDGVLSQVQNLLSERFPTQTLLGVETQTQYQINGLILLFKSSAAQWTNSEQEILTHISDSMAIAISQTKLQQQARTKNKHQSLLRNLSREIAHISHPDLLFKNCLTQICNTLQLDRGMVLMLKYQNPLQAKNRRGNKSIRGTVEIACEYSAERDSLDSQTKKFFSFSHSDLCQQAWQTAPQYLCFESDTKFPDLVAENIPDSIQTKGSALLMMPLMGKKNSETSPAVVWGFLVLQHDSFHSWSEDELDLIDWISVQVSTAIVHHQTLNQVQSIVEERTAQLKWSLDVQAKLSEKMRHNIERLQKLNQLKDDFMSSMSHELKTPLTSMKMAIMMLRQAQISPDMKEKYLNILEQEWNREYSLIKDLLTLQEVESGELTYTPQELNLNHTIDNLARAFQEKWHVNKGISLETKISESDLIINTDVDSLTHILNELLLNAGKYSAVDTIIELNIESQATLKGKNIVIKIANLGAGITPEELPHIFDKFRRGQGVTDRAVPGTGLGLALVQYLVEHLNGKIDVTSEPLDCDSEIFATTFVLKLPQFQPAIS